MFCKFFRIFEENKDDDDELHEREFFILNNLLSASEMEEIDADSIALPPHYRCVSHTLNFVAVKDTEHALDNNSLYKKKYRTVCAKLLKLWSKQNQSTQIADRVKEICGVYLKTPVITRYKNFLCFYLIQIFSQNLTTNEFLNSFYLGRWNSTYDFMVQLVELLKDGPEKIDQCLDYCNLQRLNSGEIKFLQEYCQVNCKI